MRQAIILAAEKMIGSYAAVIADPVTETLWCIKAGSSLYFGIGEIEDQKFCLVPPISRCIAFYQDACTLQGG
jgi:hypothetical protein